MVNIKAQSLFVYDVLINIIDGYKNEQKVLNQIEHAQIKSYEYTGWGVFIYFDIAKVIEYDKIEVDILFQGLLIESTEFSSPYTEALFKIKNGYIDYLEIESTYDNYPHKDLTDYKLIKTWKQKDIQGNIQ